MTTVSRSTYQKVVEENKRLKEDIKVLANRKDFFEFLSVTRKWREIFRKEDELSYALKQAAEQYFKDHPELNKKIIP